MVKNLNFYAKFRPLLSTIWENMIIRLSFFVNLFKRLFYPNVKAKNIVIVSKVDSVTNLLLLYFQAFLKTNGNVEVKIHVAQEVKHFSHRTHYIFVVPSKFRKFGDRYSVLNLEGIGGGAYRLNSKTKFAIKKATKVIDFSQSNLNGIQAQVPSVSQANTLLLPMTPIPGWDRGGKSLKADFESRDIPVLFYGNLKSSRRQQALEQIKSICQVYVAEGTWQDTELLIRRSRVVINIHAYGPDIVGALRLAECFSSYTPIVSETFRTSDEFAHHRHVNFIDCGEWHQIAEEALRFASDSHLWISRSMSIQKAIDGASFENLALNDYVLGITT